MRGTSIKLNRSFFYMGPTLLLILASPSFIFQACGFSFNSRALLREIHGGCTKRTTKGVFTNSYHRDNYSYESPTVLYSENKLTNKFPEPNETELTFSQRIGAALILSVAVIIRLCFTIISPGEVGVVTTLGKISQVEPGLHFINPVSKVITYSTKTQLLDQENFVPTKEGLTVELDTSVLYRINPKAAKDIYASIGEQYEQTIISPEVSSAVRGLTSESDAKALYSGGGRNLIQNNLKEDLTEKLEGRGIVIEDVLLRNLKLPTEVTVSIEAKAKAEQDSSRMEFILAKERQEAERKAVEAQGIAEFQRIVSEGISPNLLQWKGIEATQKLAYSPNTKIVIIGNSKDGMPLILGGNEASK